MSDKERIISRLAVRDDISIREALRLAYEAGECRAPAPQPSKEEAEIAVDKMFKNWLSRHCFFYANKTLRASGWREIAILLYRRSATPQAMPTCTCPCHTEKERCEQCCDYRGASEQAPQELELEQEADGRWLAEFMRFPGVAAYGPSKEEAIRNAAKVLIESGPQVTPTPSEKVVEAARSIHHWHDWGRDNEGMVVSSEHVRKLWESVGEYDKSIAEGTSEQASPTPDKCPKCGSRHTWAHDQHRCNDYWHTREVERG